MNDSFDFCQSVGYDVHSYPFGILVVPSDKDKEAIKNEK